MDKPKWRRDGSLNDEGSAFSYVAGVLGLIGFFLYSIYLLAAWVI